MARPKKKDPNPQLSMEALLQKAVEAYGEPYDDREDRDTSLLSSFTQGSLSSGRISRFCWKTM